MPSTTERRADDRHEEAVAAHRAGRLEEAESLYRAQLAEHPGDVETGTWLAVLLHQRGEHGRALALLDELSQHAPAASSRREVVRALVFHALGRTDEARRACEHALRTDESCVPAWSELALIASERGELVEAERLHREVIARAPGLAAAHHNLGVTLSRLGRDEASIASYERAAELDPSYVAPRVNLANALHRLRRPVEAAALYRRVLELDPTHGLALHMSAALAGRSPPACPSSFVVGLFDDCADRFDEQLVDRLGYATPSLLRERVEAHGPGQFARAIDLGCGTGLAGVELRSRCAILVGVDLSPRMIERARARGVYDALYVAEVVEHLRVERERYELAMAADVAPYLGDLGPWMRALAGVCAAGGLVVFSTEAADEAELTAGGPDGWVLRTSGRYAHARACVVAAASAAGLALLEVRAAPLRREGDAEIRGDLFVLRAPTRPRR